MPVFLIMAIISVYILTKNSSNYVVFTGKVIHNFDCTKEKIISKKIVILSETSHGSENIRSLETCIIKKLVLEENFDSIILEYDYLETSWISDYVNGDKLIKREDVKDMLKNTLYFSASFFDLIDWVKIFNTKSNRKIKFFGIDNFNFNFIYYRIKNSKNLPKNLINCIINNYDQYSYIYTECISQVNFQEANIFHKDTYFLVLLKRALENLSNFQQNGNFDEENRDLNMFQTFSDIYKNYSLRKFIFSIHAGHSLALPERFGSYLKNSKFNFSNYIISLCSGEASAYRNVDSSIFRMQISPPEKDLIEFSICNNEKPNSAKQNKLFRFTNRYDSTNTMVIPDYSFDGFIVVKESKPLEPLEK